MHKVLDITSCGIEKEEKYKEALRKCSPYNADYDADAVICSFCGMEEDYNILGDEVHADNCEYLKLVGGDGKTR